MRKLHLIAAAFYGFVCAAQAQNFPPDYPGSNPFTYQQRIALERAPINKGSLLIGTVENIERVAFRNHPKYFNGWPAEPGDTYCRVTLKVDSFVGLRAPGSVRFVLQKNLTPPGATSRQRGLDYWKPRGLFPDTNKIHIGTRLLVSTALPKPVATPSSPTDIRPKAVLLTLGRSIPSGQYDQLRLIRALADAFRVKDDWTAFGASLYARSLFPSFDPWPDEHSAMTITNIQVNPQHPWVTALRHVIPSDSPYRKSKILEIFAHWNVRDAFRDYRNSLIECFGQGTLYDREPFDEILNAASYDRVEKFRCPELVKAACSSERGMPLIRKFTYSMAEKILVSPEECRALFSVRDRVSSDFLYHNLYDIFIREGSPSRLPDSVVKSYPSEEGSNSVLLPKWWAKALAEP